MSNFKITESGFYKLSEIDASEITFSEDISVTLFDEGNISKKIFVSERVSLSLVGILEKEEDYFLEIIHIGEYSESEVKYLLLSKNSEGVQAKIHSRIEANNAKTDVKIVSFAGNNGIIDLDGIIDLAPNHEKMAGYLTEENIFLGNTGKIRGIPTLLVKSDDVEAGHACKIHKISDEKLFYLRSRGIPKDDANLMILESKILETLSPIKGYNQDIFEEKYTSILGKILD